MLWRGRSGSNNVEDRRGFSTGGVIKGGGAIGIVIYLLYALLGGDPSQLPNINQMQSQQSERTLSPEEQQAEDTMAQFVSVVLAETETSWKAIFEENGMVYENPKLVLFRGQVQSGCGNAGAESGPFYCPADRKLYIDLSFYEELRTRFHASGDFAMAYVIAHEVGHHVQNLLGTSEKVARLRDHMTETQYNKYSVKLELQADYFAGVWAHHAQKLLEAGDIEEALNAASAVGDDNIQKQSRGYVVPDAFTHGTSKQRQEWFYKGFKSGTIQDGNTFESADLDS
jgi:hypothetical protein